MLNLVAAESEGARHASAALACERPQALLADLAKIERLELPQRHHIEASDLRLERLAKLLALAYARQPQDFEALLGIQGVGPRTVRALALIAELVHGAAASRRDPARFSFAHGGKDGHPFPVDRPTYDASIDVLRRAVVRARLGQRERLEALRRLAAVTNV